MFNALLGFFPRKRKTLNSPLEELSMYASITSQINKLTNTLTDKKMEKILNNTSEYYISLQDLFKMIEKEELEVKDILKHCSHVSELQPSKFSIAEVYARPLNQGILLTSEKDPEFQSDKIKIITVKQL